MAFQCINPIQLSLVPFKWCDVDFCRLSAITASYWYKTVPLKNEIIIVEFLLLNLFLHCV